MKKSYILLILLLLVISHSFSQTYFTLSSGALTQNWSDGSLITTNDNWTAISNIRGFLGQDLTTNTGTNPSTILSGASSVANDVDVIANQAAPNTLASGGIAEFDGIPNPTIGLQGSGTSDAANLVIYLNTSGVNNITVQYNLRDVDGSTDNSIQPVALQYRVGNTGNFANIPLGFVADASTGPSLATLVTAVNITLPPACDNQPAVEIRIITANASGIDEWIGIDDINIFGGTLPACLEPAEQPSNLVLNASATNVNGSFALIPGPTTIQNYLIVRSTSAALTQLPVDGVSYSTGQIIEAGNGMAIGLSSDGTFTNNVSPATQYFYFIFSLNDQGCGGGPNYNQITPLSGDVTTPALAGCITPVTPTALTLTPSNTSIAGSFTLSGATKYIIIICSSTLNASPVNAVVYTAGQSIGNGTVIGYGNATTFTATGLTVATSYNIYVFAANDACTGEPFYSPTSLDGGTTTTNNTTGIPVGYYDAASAQTCQPLKTAVKTIVTNGYQVLSYTPGLWNLYLYSDMHRNDANTADIIWDMYSDNPTGPEPYVFPYGPVSSGGKQCGTYSQEGDCYNREHSTPQSWFNQVSPMVSDAQHIFPTDGEVNNMRSNYPYGEVTNLATVPPSQNNPSLNGSKLGTGSSSQNFGYTGTVFEPINEYKGDFARASLYMAVRYEDQIISQDWSSLGTANQVFLSTADEPDAVKRRLQIYDSWYLNLLLKWHNNDVVSQKEIDRNNAIYYQNVNTTNTGVPKAQSNRNPFIDHPEYAAIIFQCTGVLPVSITDFIALKQKETVLLKWYATYETNFKLYEIQRSTDASDFSTIGEITGQNLANYFFVDKNLPVKSIVYYRLKMIDIDGTVSYSKIIAIKLSNNFSNALLYPNPTIGPLNIKLTEAIAHNTFLIITDIAGRLIKKQSIAKGQLSIDLQVQAIPAGRYFIKINDQHSVINQSFVIIK